MAENPSIEPQKRKVPRKVTEKSLENAALYYLQRFSSSNENFLRVMMRRVNRSAQHHNTNPEEGAKIIDNLIKKFIKIGLLNDLRFAEVNIINFRRRGLSQRMIRAKLVSKGLSNEIINQSFLNLQCDKLDPELTASIIFTRKRRLGAFRGSEDKRQEFQEKDMAKMARAGFGYHVAREVIKVRTIDELEQMVDNITLD